MQNLQKYTKAELISKFKKLDSKNNNKSILVRFVEGILLFKSFIFKITLIALLIKIFKKYRIFALLWRITNWIAVTVFGMSVMDIYGINFISNIFTFLRESSIYLWISSLLGNNSEVKKIPSRLDTINHAATGTEKNSTVIERIKDIIQGEPEIIVEDDTPIYKNKYVITAAILILLGLSYWYFKDSVDPVISDTVEKLGEFRSGITKHSTDSSTNIPNDTSLIDQTGWWKRLTNKVKSWWNKGDKPDSDRHDSSVSAQNLSDYFENAKQQSISDHQRFKDSMNLKGKDIDSSNLSEWEKTRRLMAQMTANTEERFNNDSQIAINQMTTFIQKYEEGSMPDNLDLIRGMYVTIDSDLSKANSISNTLWINLFKDKELSDAFTKFQAIRKDIGIPSFEELLEGRFTSAQSDTYAEIAQATIQEQDVWSNRGSVQSPHSNISEIGLFDQTTEQVEIPELKVRTPKTSYAETLEKVSTKRDDTNLVENITSKVKSKFNNLFDAINARRDDSHVVESSNDQKDVSLLPEFQKELENVGYYKNQEEQITQIIEGTLPDNKPKSKFSSLFDAINARRDDSHVVESVTPKANSPSSGSVKDYFVDKGDKLTSLIEDANILSDQEILTKVKETFSEDQPIASSSKLVEDDTPGFSDLLQQIKSQRKEYGTPVIATREEILREVETLVATPKIDTPKSGLSVILDKVKSLVSPNIETKTPIEQDPHDLFTDTAALFDNDSVLEVPVISNWSDVKVNFNEDGDKFTIDFGDKLNETSQMVITYIDGNMQGRPIDSTYKGVCEFLWEGDDSTFAIHKIHLLDKSDISHEVYFNPSVEVLKDFHINKMKSISTLKAYLIEK
jgi:hypothetical protein